MTYNEFIKNKPQVGQKIIVVTDNDLYGNSLKETTISYVGEKYFYLHKLHPNHYRFHIDTKEQDKFIRFKVNLYPSKEAYYNQINQKD